MTRLTTHFDQVPLKDIMEAVQKEAHKAAAEPAYADIAENREASIIAESGPAKLGVRR
jgi:ERCC4-related helicase